VIFISNGLGCLVIPIVIIGAVAMASIAQFEPNIRWPRMIAVLGTALATFGLGLILNRPKVMQDQWGNRVSVREDHSLYWIPVQYWAPIILVVGTLVVFFKK
jgi:hypothetical protein